VPTVVLDQLVKGVVAADDELELEEPLPAQATNKIGIPHNKIDFKITPIQYLLDLQNVQGRWSKTTLEIIGKRHRYFGLNTYHQEHYYHLDFTFNINNQYKICHGQILY
jgi:hypothetical protein